MHSTEQLWLLVSVLLRNKMNTFFTVTCIIALAALTPAAGIRGIFSLKYQFLTIFSTYFSDSIPYYNNETMHTLKHFANIVAIMA